MWPDELYEFAWIPERNDQLRVLAEEAEEEDWSFQHVESEYPLPVLYNYIRNTYKRVAEENKITLSENGEFTCFDTGLVTPLQEPIYASFQANRRDDAQPWYFKGWFRRGQWELNKFPELPPPALYFEDPTCLVFDNRKEFRVNIEHIIEDTPRERFPESYSGWGDHLLQNVLTGAIENAKEGVRRSYRTAVPQYHKGQVQLLLPLCLSEPQKADLALVVERHATFYRASTCLTLDMAYANARLLARLDRGWLQP